MDAALFLSKDFKDSFSSGPSPKRDIKVDWNGLEIVIEYLPGDVRESGHYVYVPYGMIPGTISMEEGDDLDVLLGKNVEAPYVFAVELIVEGETSEYKYVLGASTVEEAEEVFCNQYDRSMMGSVTATSLADFVETVNQSRQKAEKTGETQATFGERGE